jgi:hypothetical protein
MPLVRQTDDGRWINIGTGKPEEVDPEEELVELLKCLQCNGVHMFMRWDGTAVCSDCETELPVKWEITLR